MANQNFARNLRTICNQHRSVAHVCRSLEMNRQQFNKYLSGQIFPSRHNLQRICQFFKLSEGNLALDPAEFERLISDIPKADSSQGNIETLLDSIPNAIDALARYEGYYYSHFHALGFPGSMVRSLVQIYRLLDCFYTKNIEHLWNKEKGRPKHHRFKYRGIAFYLADRIFITEHETLTKNVICHTILFPSYRNAIDTLSGITTGVGSLNTHMPKSTRVEYKYLGKQIDLREALNGCGLFDLDSNAISDEIRHRINNEILPHEHMLMARDQ
jgi:transcriptional regulator with XRE-family HTH domain